MSRKRTATGNTTWRTARSTGVPFYLTSGACRRAPDETDALLPALLEKKVVICNEVACGVVPIDRAERVARELTGRVCVALAEKAEKVVRIYCGIPTIIKE